MWEWGLVTFYQGVPATQIFCTINLGPPGPPTKIFKKIGPFLSPKSHFNHLHIVWDACTKGRELCADDQLVIEYDLCILYMFLVPFKKIFLMEIFFGQKSQFLLTKMGIFDPNFDQNLKLTKFTHKPFSGVVNPMALLKVLKIIVLMPFWGVFDRKHSYVKSW